VMYLGGKSRISKRLVAAILQDCPVSRVWDPFCGGVSMTAAFARAGCRVLASDIQPCLVSLYQGLLDGWTPPVEPITEEQYHAAKGLPDSDPLKAFIGYGVSFGGKYFAGYALRKDSTRKPYCASTKISLDKDFRFIRGNASFRVLSFLDVTPRPVDDVLIYCDPPYEGTARYVTGAFGHRAFEARVRGWADCGVPIYVSEYAVPDWADVVWSKDVALTVKRGSTERRVELLWTPRGSSGEGEGGPSLRDRVAREGGMG